MTPAFTEIKESIAKASAPIEDMERASFGHQKMFRRKRILLIGHARHGKDTVAEMLSSAYKFTFQSSSVAAAKIFLFDTLKNKYGYEDFNECFEDRVNHRKEWHDLICEYNREDRARLARDIMKENDIYVGMRSSAECNACLEQNVFDIVIGVFDQRKPLEDRASFDIDIWRSADIVISNSGTLQDLERKIKKLHYLFV